MTKIIQAVRGMKDILPDEAERWEAFESLVRDWLRGYGYRPMRMPLVEPTPLFKRAIGEVTDIVEKEMYTFGDAEESLTLRPEGTASCVRAVLEHNLLYDGPKRLWYMGPMFRRERPQKGRYRQFYQVGVEALGFAEPAMDAELILMGQRLWDDLDIHGVKLELNSLGSLEERARHRVDLVAYLEKHQDRLDEDSRRRLGSNPLRILDTKNPHMQELVEGAPRLTDYLGDASLAHFESVRQLLSDAGIPHRVNPRLVRGLDYYNRTVFEWVTDRLGAQGTICAGGRYDGLFEQLGGKPQPAAGFALGVERVLALWDEAQSAAFIESPDLYVVHDGEGAGRVAFSVAEELRDGGFAVQLHAGGGNFKAQMKRADGSGAKLALIVGEDEVRVDAVTVKPLRESRPQLRVARNELALHIADYLFGDEDEHDGNL
ncbi:MAG: histidine--tRNA ligase [Rhodocyclaceae bacterium]|nr:histidine--tRNA ligase [Rhodocyclaceae bacterium]MBX3669096.1 histidine--tRNA ligase [Rhodocyclaceae bacterium]